MALLERTKQLLPRLACGPAGLANGGASLLDAGEDEQHVPDLVLDAVLGYVTHLMRDFTGSFVGPSGARLMRGLLDVARTALQCRLADDSAAQVRAHARRRAHHACMHPYCVLAGNHANAAVCLHACTLGAEQVDVVYLHAPYTR